MYSNECDQNPSVSVTASAAVAAVIYDEFDDRLKKRNARPYVVTRVQYYYRVRVDLKHSSGKKMFSSYF